MLNPTNKEAIPNRGERCKAVNEGAWIRVRDGNRWFVDEHADWIKREPNALQAGLPKSVWETIAPIRNDYIGENRKKILLAVMGAGFIRMRGHDTVIVFEFTVTTAKALQACKRILEEVAGEFSRLRFNSLTDVKSVELLYRDYVQHIDSDVDWLLKPKLI
ncbi:MAG: hypothetical protein ABSD20_21245 [Terriglobales bacterium]|jgi:hypothetical protein